MAAPAVEVRRRQAKRSEPDQVRGAGLGKGIQQLVEGLAPGGLDLGEAIERSERALFTEREQDLGADDPVSALAGQAGDRRVLL